MPWAVEAVQDYLVNIRPRYRCSGGSAVWLTERGGRLKPREMEERFAEYRDELGLDVSGDFMNTMMRKALDRAYAADQET
ncbi:hypothetical protein ACGFNV_35945 [Streptomyces sp. NPDC048751]|uniref:hypothetical protein n=1 Tax=Streptomyces sp. NPDC048751 TaxID=3365591 RepID=UPI0037231A72